MRYDKRYTRTLSMLTAPEVPRTAGGGILLCKMCQRALFFAGGLLPLLARDLRFGAIAKLTGSAR